MLDTDRAKTVLLWHVHGSWTTSFVHSGHRCLIPTVPGRGEWGRGRAGRDWPENAVEVPFDQLADADVDAVVLQRPEELELTRQWLRRTPGRDVPAVYVEHNAPREHAATTRHPLADQSAIGLVHVTEFNRLMWDNGACPTTVIEHGVVDPGHRYTGELPRACTSINEPLRRWRITGTDLLPAFGAAAPVDVYGIGAADLQDPYAGVHGVADLPLDELHDAMARRRVYLHLPRWTSLGLALLEAMHLGMPVVALATTEAVRAVPPEAGAISTDIDELLDATRMYMADEDVAAVAGKAARTHALTHYGLPAFQRRWDALLDEVCR